MSESDLKSEERDNEVRKEGVVFQEKLRERNEYDEKPDRVFVVSRGTFGEFEGAITNPEVSLKVGDPILLKNQEGTTVDRLVTAEDVEKQRLINSNRDYLGAKGGDPLLWGSVQAEACSKRADDISSKLLELPSYKGANAKEQVELRQIFGETSSHIDKMKEDMKAENVEKMISEKIFFGNGSEEDVKKYNSLPEDQKKAFREDKVKDVFSGIAAKEVGKMKLSEEEAIQKMVIEDMAKQGKNPTKEEVLDILNAGGGAGRVEAFAEFKRRQLEATEKENMFCANQGDIKALDQALKDLNNPELSKDKIKDVLRKISGNSLNAAVDISFARQAKRDGFDRVSTKAADPEIIVPPVGTDGTSSSWMPGGYPGERHTVSPLPPEGTPPPSWTPGGYPGTRYDVKPLPPGGPGPGPDGPIGPTGPETPPIGPRGPERVVFVQDLKNEYDRLRDVYIMDRRATRGAGLERGILERDRADMERAKEAYLGAQMRAAMESVRSATAGMEGEEAARAQTEALTAIGLDLNTRLDAQFLQSEREREPNGWYAKFNRFWMSKAGSAVKVVGGVGLTTIGGFTGLLPLVGLGTTMAASGIGWEAGKVWSLGRKNWGMNKIRTPEEIERMAPEQVDVVLNSQRELMRRQGRVDPERVATIQALEARRDQILQERMRERVQRMILEEGGLSSENITRATTDALNLENGSFLRTGEATDERARAWEIRRRKIAGIAGGIGVGLANLAAQWGAASVNFVNDAATRTAMRADYNKDGVWNWVRNNGKEYWDTARQTWHSTGGTGGFSGAKEVILNVPNEGFASYSYPSHQYPAGFTEGVTF
ncbi:MAG: hypothetical protein HZA35_02835 [Parcubacteria group bacterium]|nr:hypothetical protein [Parcubacteria group bacterium]